MDIAIVTGASSSLGLAISRRLIQLGFRVYGLGGDYTNCDLQNVNFRPVSCDLANPAAVEAAAKQILEKEKGVCLLVNNAKYFGRNPFLGMATEEIETILRVNLLCPLILVRTLAESLKELQGYVIQLGAPHSDTSRGGPAGAAASGGLKWMGEVLFHDLRSHGVRVCHLSPEPNPVKPKTGQVRKGARPEATIDPEAVAQAVEQMLQSPYGNVITEMILRPLRIEEPAQEPVVNLPYPDPQPIPYTVPREYIEAEEQLEEEEAKKQAAQKKRKRRRRKPAKEESTKEEKPAKKQAQSKPVRKKQVQEDKPVEEAPKPRRRSRRKPKPPVVEVGFHKRDQPGKSEDSPKPDSQRSDQKADATEKPASKKAVKKAAVKSARKTPTKAARKTATKKTVAKKAVKKAARKATKKAVAKKAVKKAAKKVARKATRKTSRPAKPATKPDNE